MMLDVPVLDAHVHFWEPRSTPRVVSPVVKALGWNDRLLMAAGRRLFPEAMYAFVGKPDYVMHAYLPGDWHRDHGAFETRGLVHVQAGWHDRKSLGLAGETRWLESLCASDLRGIVAEARLDAPGLTELLDAHQSASGRLRGVRDMTAWDADPKIASFTSRGDRMRNPAWQGGLELLGKRGLTLDAWCYEPQLDDLEAALRAAPDTRVVLCHVGTPIGLGGPFAGRGGSADERERIAARWHEKLARLATHTGLWIKLSGLVMPIVGFGFHERQTPPSASEVADKLGPHIEHALRAFGVERCFFASNFPIEKVSVSWTTLFEAFAQLTRTLERTERQKLFADNAQRFYGIAA